MATEYITYDEYLNRARKQAEERQAAYVAARDQSAAETIKSLNTAQAASRAQIQQETEEKIRQEKQAYQGLYDENAVREKVAQLNVEERLANLGLTDSGVNRTQQTALAATRARADAQVSLKKQQAVDTLLNEMTAAIEKNRVALKEAENRELAAARQDEEENRLALEKEAQSVATAQFNADLKAAEQAYDLELEQKKYEGQMHKWAVETAQQNAKIAGEAELQKQKQNADIALQQQKQADATALQKQKQADAMTLQSKKQADSTALQKQKQADSTALQKQKQADSTVLQTKKQADATALQKQKQADATSLQKQKQTDATALQTQQQNANIALQQQKQADATALQRQKQADAAALQSAKAASSGTSKTTSGVTGSQKAELAESLRKALKERSEIYNEAMRADYDKLIAYYESLLY